MGPPDHGDHRAGGHARSHVRAIALTGLLSMVSTPS